MQKKMKQHFFFSLNLHYKRWNLRQGWKNNVQKNKKKMWILWNIDVKTVEKNCKIPLKWTVSRINKDFEMFLINKTNILTTITE